MKRTATGLLALVWSAMGVFVPAQQVAAQRVSIEVAAGSGDFVDDLTLGGIDPDGRGVSRGAGASFGIDGRLGILTGDRWEFGAAFSVTRATLELFEPTLTGRTCLEAVGVSCGPPPELVESHDYSDVVSWSVSARFWPAGVANAPWRVRPLVGLHTGVLWYNDQLDHNLGLPLGIDAGMASAMTDRAYVLTYVTGQMLLVSRRIDRRDGFGFRWAARVGLGFRM